MVTTAETPAEGEEAVSEGEGETAEGENAEDTQTQEEAATSEDTGTIWESFDVDATTGYYIDPNTGNLIDPESGHAFGGDDLPDFDAASIFESTQDGNGN